MPSLTSLLREIWSKDTTWSIEYADNGGMFLMKNDSEQWYQAGTLEEVVWMVWRYEYV